MEIVLTCTQCVGRCPLTVWKESSNSGICILTVTSPHEQWRKVGPPLLITIYLTSVSALYNLQLELQSVQDCRENCYLFEGNTPHNSLWSDAQEGRRDTNSSSVSSLKRFFIRGPNFFNLMILFCPRG